MTQENYNRLEKYLSEQMTPKENEEFLNDLRNDKELCEEVQTTALMIKVLKENQAKQDAEIIEEVLASKKKAKILSWFSELLHCGTDNLTQMHFSNNIMCHQKSHPHEAQMEMRSNRNSTTYLLEWEQKKTLPPLLIDYKPFMIILWQTMRNMMNTNIPRTQLIGILLWLT